MKLIDFGIARATSHSSRFTRSPSSAGQLSSLAPEQLLGTHLDRPTDIFAIGVIFHLLTTGKPPLLGSKGGLRELVTGCPAALDEVVLRALSSAPDDRWATARDMLSALERAMPQAFERSFDAKVAAYAGDLLHERCEQRRMLLRESVPSIDRPRVNDAVRAKASTNSSLRPFAIDPTRAASNADLAALMDAPTEPAARSRPRPRADRRSTLISGGALAFGMVIGFWVFQPADRAGDVEKEGAAAGLVPAISLESVVAMPVIRRPVVEPAPGVVNVVAGNVTDEPGTVQPDRPAAMPVPVTANATPAPSASAARAGNVSSHGEAARPLPPMDAWNPATFGGRH